MKIRRKIYLDFAASTPLDEKVADTMLPWFSESFANPSSIHSLGEEALTAVLSARKKAASVLQSKPEEIIFTASATEADNLAILGFCHRVRKLLPKAKLNLVVSALEHEAVLSPAYELDKEGFELRIVAPDETGRLKTKDVMSAVDKNTVLVSVMYANNETGVIQPISGIAEAIKRWRREYETALPVLQTDAVQAANFLDLRPCELGADFLVLSSHKIYGPKGAGLLYMREGLSIDPLIFGGGQEFRLRSGTENVPAIVGFSQALQMIDWRYAKQIRALRDYLEGEILKRIPDVMVVGKEVDRLPNISCFLFKGIEGESILLSLDKKGIFVSTGSACSSKSLKPSHVLLSMGFSPEAAHGSLRISLGKETSKSEIKKLLRLLPGIVKKLRKMSPFYESEK